MRATSAWNEVSDGHDGNPLRGDARMTVYHGYKDGKRVAYISRGWYMWRLARMDRPVGEDTISFHSTRDAAKAAWRRIDGPGTRWRPA